MAIRFRFTCPVCGMMSDLKHLDQEPTFRVVEQELGGRIKGSGGQTKYGKLKTPRTKGAVGIMTYTDIVTGSRMFTQNDIDANNPYVNQGILQPGDDVVEKTREYIKSRLKKVMILFEDDK